MLPHQHKCHIQFDLIFRKFTLVYNVLNTYTMVQKTLLHIYKMANTQGDKIKHRSPNLATLLTSFKILWLAFYFS
jgi:hypothetical protein